MALAALVPPGRRAVRITWWKILKEEQDDVERRVTCLLEDGSSVEGWLLSFNPDTDESADRELALSAPLVFRDPAGTAREEAFGAVSISTRRVFAVYVDYRDRPT
jgi:hypothetical protein